MKNSETKLSRLLLEQDFFDNSLDDAGHSLFSYYTDSFLKILEDEAHKYLPSLEGKRLLFYGCGVNWTRAFQFYKDGAGVKAVDISSVSIRTMQRKTKIEGVQSGIEFEQMDCENLDYPDESFDIVYGRAILHHLDLEAVNRELLRVLRKEGVGVFIEPLGMNPLINLYRWLTPKLRTVDEKPLDYEDIAILGHGFSDVKYKELTLSALPIIISQSGLSRFGFNCLNLKGFYKFDHQLFRFFPFLRRYCWNVILVLKK